MFTIKCLNADGSHAETYQSESYTAKTITPFKHEVVLKERLIEIDATPRQATGPVRYNGAEVYDDAGVLLWSGDTAGSASRGVKRDAVTYTDDQLRKVLAERKVRFRKTLNSDQLLSLVLNNGGTPTNEELGIEVSADEVAADEDA